LPGSPYVGLGNFTERQSAFFFGREADIKRIIGNLRVARLTLLYAESGVGKSSVLRAGVAARLDELATAPGSSARPSDLPVIFSSWTSDPLPALIDAIGRAIEPFVDGPLQLPHDSLEGAIEEATRLAERDLLVILDQFEEYFSYQAHDGADRSFPDQIAQCINRRDLRANILISIREDAYARLGDLLKARVANVYANYLHLDYLDAVAARDAIVKPVQRWNELHGYDVDVDVEPALVDTVVEQVRLGAVVTGEHELTAEGQLRGDESAKIETTYLQLVMKRLWDEESAAGSHVLRLETLQSLGGAQQIIGTHLDTAMAELTPEQQAVAADVFRFLVTRTGMKIAFSSADLADMSGRSTEEVAPVLSRLSGADLHILRSVAMPDDGQGSNYEIFHDALAQPIRDWRSRYLRGQVEEQQKLELERQQAQLAATRAQLRRARRRWVVLSAVSVLLAGLLVATFALWRRSEDLSHRSKSADLAAQALSEGSSPERSLQLATQAVDEAKTPEALLAVRAALAKPHVSFSSGPLGSYLEDTQVDRHGDWLAVGADNGTWLWNTRTGASRSLEGEPKGPVAIHFSADGSRLLVVDFFAPRVFDMHGRNVGGELTAPPDRGFWVDGAISRDGQRVLLLAGSGVVLQNSDGSGSTTLAVDGPRIVTAQFLAGGRFVTISEDNVLTVWSPDGTKEATRAGVAAYAASPDGSILAAGTHDGVVHLWRVPDMTQITSFPTPDEIEQLLFDDQRAGTVTAVGAHGTVSILDPAQPDQFPRVVRTGEQIDPNGVAGSARPLLMTSGSGSLAIWDTQVGTPLERFDLSGRIFDLRLADDGSYSFVQVSWVKGANDQATAVLRARLWEGRTVSVAASLPEDAGQASFSRDHRHVVVVYQQPEGYAVEVRASPDLAPERPGRATRCGRAPTRTPTVW
jgi:WD40 repeat protein